MNIEKLKNLYKLAYANIEDKENLRPFVFQIGPRYLSESSKRVLFVGKSVNGWRNTSRNPDDWFDPEYKNRLFMLDDQIEWVLNLEGPNDEYNSKRSAFWRLIRRITDNESEKFLEIAWTNLYKFSPPTGNPSSSLCNQQQSYAIEILLEEISILNPRIVVFLTSGWEKCFLDRMPGIKHIATKNWCEYKTSVHIFGDIKFIVSVHPQGKPEADHAMIIKNEFASA